MSYILTANTPPPVILHLDSRFATQYLEQDSNGRNLTTNYIYTMKEPIVVPDHMNVLVSLHTATIPYSFYNVREGVNDTIKYRFNGGAVNDLVLPAGNYSANRLATLMKTAFEDGTGLTANITYSRESLKFTFTITGGSQFSFDFRGGGLRNGEELIGMDDEVETTIPIGVATKSTKAIDLNDSIHGLYIRQNIATKGTLDNESGVFTNILARLPITTNAGGIIFYTPSSNDHETMVSVPTIQTIGIKLSDDRNRSIDLNGLHFQMSIKISYIHKEVLRKPPPRRYANPLVEERNQKLTEKRTKKKK
tara:strand:+ start:1231 stop:2151 length:921 start_codon:yes stop_codon:yes gene_type:complete